MLIFRALLNRLILRKLPSSGLGANGRTTDPLGHEYYGQIPEPGPGDAALWVDQTTGALKLKDGDTGNITTYGAGGEGGGVALSNADPADLAPTAAAGSSEAAARGDHVHQLPSLADLGAAAATHDHDDDYAAIDHDHDGDYADIDHSHSAYALTSHLHDDRYSLLNHTHAGGGGGGGGGGDSTYTGAFGVRPAATNDGDLFLPTDVPVLQRANGSTWASWGPLFRFVDPPALGSWTQINISGGATVEQAGPHIYLECPAPGATAYAIRALALAVPGSTPWTLTAHWLPNWVPAASNVIGIGVRDNTTGRIESIKNFQNESIYQSRWASVTSWSSNPKIQGTQGGQAPTWLRITDDGTNLIWKVSRDGLHWMTHNTSARNAYVASIDQIIFLLDARSTTASVGARLVHWEVT
jgi:hypothetical protein